MTTSDPQFSLLRRGSETPAGPYSQEDILRFLQNNEIDRKDFVFYDGMKDWKPIEEVFDISEQISHFVDDGQDRAKVGAAFREVSSILASGEEVYYIAVQERTGLLSKSKQSVILTDRQLLLLTEKRSGYEIESHPWVSVQSTMIRDDGKGYGTFSAVLNNEKRIDVSHLPTNQTQRLFQLSHELSATEPAAA